MAKISTAHEVTTAANAFVFAVFISTLVLLLFVGFDLPEMYWGMSVKGGRFMPKTPTTTAHSATIALNDVMVISNF